MTSSFYYDITAHMNFRMFFSFLIFFAFSSAILAQTPVPNVVYLSFDGVSPGPLFTIMKQKKIPNINRMSKKGSKYILKGVLDKPNLKDGLAVLWTGYPVEVEMSRHDSAFVFNRLKHSVPNLKSIVIISRPKRTMEKEKEWGKILKRSLRGVDTVYDEKERTSDEISLEVVDAIRKTDGPFILFANYPVCAQIALSYREGCSRYAEGILCLNRQIGVIQDALKEKGVLDNTIFVLTASYSFIENSQFPSSKSWVICSKPLGNAKTQLDLVPTLYSFYNVSYTGFEPKFSGKSLVLSR